MVSVVLRLLFEAILLLRLAIRKPVFLRAVNKNPLGTWQRCFRLEIHVVISILKQQLRSSTVILMPE